MKHWGKERQTYIFKGECLESTKWKAPICSQKRKHNLVLRKHLFWLLSYLQGFGELSPPFFSSFCQDSIKYSSPILESMEWVLNFQVFIKVLLIHFKKKLEYSCYSLPCLLSNLTPFPYPPSSRGCFHPPPNKASSLPVASILSRVKCFFPHWGQIRQSSVIYVPEALDLLVYVVRLVTHCLRDLKSLG